MKKFLMFLIIILFLSVVTGIFIVFSKNFNTNTNTPSVSKEDVKNEESNQSSNNNIVIEEKTRYPKTNGYLKVLNGTLVNKNNEPIQLVGLSSHGIQWYSDLVTSENLKNLKDNWNINVFRIAMYTNENGYISNPEQIKEKVYNIIDMAINLDLYVIVDWHILSDNDPNIYINQSNDFFDEVSTKYCNYPNVIYEICNEPNGNNVTWNNNVKPYANQIIQTIRKNSPNALIIVGTPDWSKDISSVIENPLDFENVAYAFHFYAGTHFVSSYEDLFAKAKENNICIFVSECGLTDASGNGALYKDSFSSWINFLNENNVSWLFWSLSNKNEGSSILLPTYKPYADETVSTPNDINSYLTETGTFLKQIFSMYN